VGLTELQGKTDLAFVTACDTPFCGPRWSRMIELAECYDVVVPHVEGYDHRCRRVTGPPCFFTPKRSGRPSPRPASLQRSRTRRVTAEELADVDPGLESFMNLNSPADYAAALERAGFGRDEK